MKHQTENTQSNPKPFGIEFFEDVRTVPAYGANSVSPFSTPKGTHGCSSLKSGQDDIGGESACDTQF